MHLKQWVNPIFVGFLILFSLPLKIPSIQQMLESFLNYSFPIRLSLYTLILPPVSFFCIIWNRKRTFEIWKRLHLPLSVLFFLFFWMWLGSIFSDYPAIALKHSGRYSIYLLTFLAFLFAIEENSLIKSCHIFILIYIMLTFLTFLDLQGQINIPRLLSEKGLHIDLFFRHKPSSFFENRNPYSIASVGVFFWCITRLRHSILFSCLGIVASLYSISISGSRNGLLTLVVVLILFFIFNFKKLNKTYTTLIIIFTAIIPVGIQFIDINTTTLKNTKNSFHKLMNIKSYKDLEHLEERFTILRYTIMMGINNSTLLGSGTKTFGYEIFGKSKNLNQFNNEYYKSSYNSHNPFTTIWIEMGWVGLIATLLFIFIWYRQALRGPPILFLPVLAVCIGQILDYFVWEILFMTFQSFFFANFAVTITKEEKEKKILLR